MPSNHSDDLRSVDRELLAALRVGECMGIGELTEELGVTATAVRQRLDRLMEKGLIEREKVVSGRGRPTFCYHLTSNGQKKAGADPSDLADALWRELIALEDEGLRDRILSSVAKRLGKQFAAQANLGVHEPQAKCCSQSNQVDSVSLENRLQRLSETMSNRKIPIEVSNVGQMPVLDINACPYPTLTDESTDRAMCRLEEKMLSEALGEPMQLSSCRLDGDNCCQFSAVSAATTNSSGAVGTAAAASDM
jgi:predicted ArsR family transcriptional regulator